MWITIFVILSSCGGCNLLLWRPINQHNAVKVGDRLERVIEWVGNPTSVEGGGATGDWAHFTGSVTYDGDLLMEVLAIYHVEYRCLDGKIVEKKMQVTEGT